MGNLGLCSVNALFFPVVETVGFPITCHFYVLLGLVITTRTVGYIQFGIPGMKYQELNFCLLTQIKWSKSLQTFLVLPVLKRIVHSRRDSFPGSSGPGGQRDGPAASMHT